VERKKFNRGTVTGGIVRILISIIAIIIVVIVLKSTISDWDSEDIAGGLFMCFIALIMTVASVVFVVQGIKMIIDGRKSHEVSKKGHSENGRITDLFETEVTENNNGAVSHYSIYSLKFEYSDDNGNLCESEEQISEKVYTKLQGRTLVPILVYGERAIFDKKKFDSETLVDDFS